ncbi:helix-turn-helix transcriptional regulator [Streptomyces sp. NPDC006700]|uniref:helix-turn-helix domain-containing protein n=1 Tax=Streptomyces sp. NPDC006700 TaxID=3154479 RepID=UPI0034084012
MSTRLNQDPARLRRRRVEAGLTQKDLARLAEVTKGHMSLVEGGRRGASPALLKRLAGALNCEIADLMPPELATAGSAA